MKFSLLTIFASILNCSQSLQLNHYPELVKPYGISHPSSVSPVAHGQPYVIKTPRIFFNQGVQIINTLKAKPQLYDIPFEALMAEWTQDSSGEPDQKRIKNPSVVYYMDKMGTHLKPMAQDIINDLIDSHVYVFSFYQPFKLIWMSDYLLYRNKNHNLKSYVEYASVVDHLSFKKISDDLKDSVVRMSVDLHNNFGLKKLQKIDNTVTNISLQKLTYVIRKLVSYELADQNSFFGNMFRDTDIRTKNEFCFYFSDLYVNFIYENAKPIYCLPHECQKPLKQLEFVKTPKAKFAQEEYFMINSSYSFQPNGGYRNDFITIMMPEIVFTRAAIKKILKHEARFQGKDLSVKSIEAYMNDWAWPFREFFLETSKNL